MLGPENLRIHGGRIFEDEFRVCCGGGPQRHVDTGSMCAVATQLTTITLCLDVNEVETMGWRAPSLPRRKQEYLSEIRGAQQPQIRP